VAATWCSRQNLTERRCQVGPPDPADVVGVRIDVWLDVACVFKTRSEAQRAITGGKVEVNGQNTKPHRLVHAGDQLKITRPAGRRQLILVKSLADKHLPKAEARLLYEDHTPPPTPEELAARALERHFRAAGPRVTPGRPHRREQRRLRAEKEGDA
jgi:ribosome-associated heat shock protein Hsp15